MQMDLISYCENASGKTSLSEDPKYRNWELTFDDNTNKKKIYKLRADQGRILQRTIRYRV